MLQYFQPVIIGSFASFSPPHHNFLTEAGIQTVNQILQSLIIAVVSHIIVTVIALSDITVIILLCCS
jgi:hypothetical protein